MRFRLGYRTSGAANGRNDTEIKLRWRIAWVVAVERRPPMVSDVAGGLWRVVRG